MKKTIKNILFLFIVFALPGALLAQTQTITGHVNDDHSLPLPGVSIKVKGTTTGTNTDFDGNYSINAESGAVLEFSFIGFKTEERVVGSESVINVQMTEDSQELGEVIVTAFGRRMTKNENTSTVSTVSSDEISKRAFSNPQQALEGNVPGLSLKSTSGNPGSAPEIQIRGQNSITASTSPLYVVDGVPMDSGNISGGSTSTSLDPLALIGPENIESITVLKDASGVAPYGADGANGVILITTKEGRNNQKAQYNLNYSLGVSEIAGRELRSMSADQRLEAIMEGYWNQYGTDEFGIGAGNGTIQSRDDLYQYVYNNEEKVRLWDDLGRPDTDWTNLINRTASAHNINFSMTKGGESSNFFGSLGYNNADAVVIGSNFRRWNGKFRYRTDLNEKLNFTLNGSAANALQNVNINRSSAFVNPNVSKHLNVSWAPAYNADGTIATTDFERSSGSTNTLWTTIHDIRANDVTRVATDGTVNYDILENLSFSSTLGINYMLRYYRNYNNPVHGGGKTSNGSASENSFRLYSYTTQNSLNYDFKLGDDHNFNVSAIQEFSKFKFRSLSGSGQNFPNDFLKNISAAAGNYSASSTYSERMKMRYVGLVNYDFDKRYVMNASFSYQGDSRFSHKYDSFYSVGLGWNIHEEDFMMDFDKLNTLRFKLGYGLTGNAGIGLNEYQMLASYSAYNGNPTARVTGYGTEAEWEKSKRFDVSLDYGFFNNRLRGSVAVYLNETYDMLFRVPLPYSATFLDGSNEARVVRNAGEMTNKGLEFEASGDIVQTEDWNWSLFGNVSFNTNKVNSIPEEAENIGSYSVIQAGRKVHEWYMREWAGVDPDNGMPLWYVDRTVSDATTSDWNQAQRNYIGKNALPTYTGSIGTRLTYKDLFVDASLFFSGGNMVYEQWARFQQATGQEQMMPYGSSTQAYEGAWRKPGDVTDYPRFDRGNRAVADFSENTSTRWLHKGDYMRLRDLAVGYTFKKDGIIPISEIGVDQMVISLRGTNLWTWIRSDNLQYDPETRNDGLLDLQTPPVKTYTVSVNLKF